MLHTEKALQGQVQQVRNIRTPGAQDGLFTCSPLSVNQGWPPLHLTPFRGDGHAFAEIGLSLQAVEKRFHM